MKRAWLIILVPGLVLAASHPLAAQDGLKQLNKELVAVAARVSPAVVAIETEGGGAGQVILRRDDDAPGAPNPFERFEKRLRALPTVRVRASGVIISRDGFILTSATAFHGRKEAEVTVTTAEGRTFKGKLVGKDQRTGLAVVKIEAQDLPAVAFAKTEPPAGSLIVAVSHTPALGNSIRLGMVSATDRTVTGAGPGIIGSATQYTGLLQITTPVAPPDLGGLVADLDGNMVGMIHGAMTGRTQGPREIREGAGGIRVFRMETFGQTTVQGVSFAMPARVIQRVLEPLKKGEKVAWGYLGIYFKAEAGKGLVVRDVLDDGPAAKAGLQKDDVIVSLSTPEAGRIPLTGTRADQQRFTRTVGWTAPGTAVTLGITRDGNARDLRIVLGAAPEMPEHRAMVMPPGGEGDVRFPDHAEWDRLFDDLAKRHPDGGRVRLGIMMEPDDAGVRVAGVVTDSPAEKAELQAGDVVTRIGDVVATTPDALRTEIQKHKPGDKVSLTLKRDGKDIVKEVELDRQPRPQIVWQRMEGRTMHGRGFLGIVGENADTGLRVTRVMPGSAAEKAGLKVGDVITRAGEKRVVTLGELRDVIRAHKPNDELTLTVQRGDEEMEIKVKLGRSQQPVIRVQ